MKYGERLASKQSIETLGRVAELVRDGIDFGTWSHAERNRVAHDLKWLRGDHAGLCGLADACGAFKAKL